MLNKIEAALTTLRETKPLVLCLTNYVTMDVMANCLLALGAAPLMAQEGEEVKELVALSHTLTLNIGTLDEAFIKRARAATDYAKKKNKPMILDPVGCGASRLRTKTAQELLLFADIVRGNASEVMALFGEVHKTLGVESIHQVKDAQAAALGLAQDQNIVVVVSGAEDLIADRTKKELLGYGSPLMALITGMGCSLTAVIAAFQAVIPDPFEAARLATAYFGLCGQLASEKASAPASFRTSFIDELYQANWKRMAEITC